LLFSQLLVHVLLKQVLENLLLLDELLGKQVAQSLHELVRQVLVKHLGLFVSVVDVSQVLVNGLSFVGEQVLDELVLGVGIYLVLLIQLLHFFFQSHLFEFLVFLIPLPLLEEFPPGSQLGILVGLVSLESGEHAVVGVLEFVHKGRLGRGVVDAFEHLQHFVFLLLFLDFLSLLLHHSVGLFQDFKFLLLNLFFFKRVDLIELFFELLLFLLDFSLSALLLHFEFFRSKFLPLLSGELG